jgi:hypothetical protein
LFPEVFGVGFFVFHGLGPEHTGAGAPAAKGDLVRPGQQGKARTEAGCERRDPSWKHENNFGLAQ